MILLHWFTGWLSAYTATTSTDSKVTFPASHQPLVKSLWSRLAEPWGQQSSFQPVSQCGWVRQNRGDDLKKGAGWSLFSISLLSWKSPRCLRFLGQPSTTPLTQFWGSALFQGCHIGQLARSLASLSQSDTKRQTWKIRLSRKYVQKSSNKNKATTLIVVKSRYQVIPSGKEQSTF